MANHPLTYRQAGLDEAELRRLARVADRLFAGRPRVMPGNRPHRLRAGHGIEFLDHREYLPGDNLRDIDWLATARSRRPQVRRYRNETSADWFICLDRSASMGLDHSGKWLLALRLAAAFAYLLIHLDNRVGLILFSGQVDGIKPLGRGQQAYTGLLQLLESMPPKAIGGDSALKACAPHIRSGCQIIVISDYLVPGAMRADLSLLSGIGEGVQSIQVLGPIDELESGAGFSTLRDIESGEQTTVYLSPESRRQAEQRLQDLISQLREHCLSHRITFSSCTTKDHWKEVLLNHLLKLSTLRG